MSTKDQIIRKAKCDQCHNEFYYQLEMVPVIRVFKLVETSDPMADPRAVR